MNIMSIHRPMIYRVILDLDVTRQVYTDCCLTLYFQYFRQEQVNTQNKSQSCNNTNSLKDLGVLYSTLKRTVSSFRHGVLLPVYKFRCIL